MSTQVINTRICVRRDTTSNWNAHKDIVPLLGEVIVYTDYLTVQDTNDNIINIPNIKIGDGNSYLIDLPFLASPDSEISQQLSEHVLNTDIHVTTDEKEKWNNKLNYTYNDDGNLILNRE